MFHGGTKGATKQNTAFLWGDVNLAFDGVVRIVQLRFKGSTFRNLEGLERFVGVPMLFVDLMPERAYGSCL